MKYKNITEDNKSVFIGCIVALCLKLTWNILSGCIYFAEYAWQGWNPLAYSIVYNLSGTGVEGLLSTIVLTIMPLDKIKKIVQFEQELINNKDDIETLKQAKKIGFSDKYIAKLWNKEENEIYNLRKENNIFPVYKMIDTCSSEFESYVPYFYSTYEDENESIVSKNKKIIVLGSGPIRIGQGVEFDYSTVHAVQTIKENGYEAIIINNNPETVSTDYTTSDKLYFEPLTTEDVMNIINLEKPEGVIASLGGQTAINLAEGLMKLGVKIIGTDFEAIEKAEKQENAEEMNLTQIGDNINKDIKKYFTDNQKRLKPDEGKNILNIIVANEQIIINASAS